MSPTSWEEGKKKSWKRNKWRNINNVMIGYKKSFSESNEVQIGEPVHKTCM